MAERYQLSDSGDVKVKHAGLLGDFRLQDISTSQIDWDQIQLSEGINGQFQSMVNFNIPARSDAFIDRSGIFLEINGQVIFTPDPSVTGTFPAGQLPNDVTDLSQPAVKLANGFSDSIFNVVTASANNSSFVSDKSGRYAHTNAFVRKILTRTREDFAAGPTHKHVAGAGTYNTSIGPVNYGGHSVGYTTTGGIPLDSNYFNTEYSENDPGIGGSEFYYLHNPTNAADAYVPVQTLVVTATSSSTAVSSDSRAQVYNVAGDGITNVISNGNLAGIPVSACNDNLSPVFNASNVALTNQIYYTSETTTDGTVPALVSKQFQSIVRFGDGFFARDSSMESTLMPPGTTLNISLQQAPDALRLKVANYNLCNTSIVDSSTAGTKGTYSYQINTITLWYRFVVLTDLARQEFNRLFIERPLYHNVMRSVVIADNIPTGALEYSRSNVYQGVKPYMVCIAVPTASSQQGTFNEQWTSFGPYSKNTLGVIPVIRNAYVSWSSATGNGQKQYPQLMFNTPQNIIPYSGPEYPVLTQPGTPGYGCDPYLMTRQYMAYVECTSRSTLMGTEPPALTFSQWCSQYTVLCFKLFDNVAEKFGESQQDMETGNLQVFLSFDRPVNSWTQGSALPFTPITPPANTSISGTYSQAAMYDDLCQTNTTTAQKNLNCMVVVYGHSQIRYETDGTTPLCASVKISGFS